MDHFKFEVNWDYRMSSRLWETLSQKKKKCQVESMIIMLCDPNTVLGQLQNLAHILTLSPGVPVYTSSYFNVSLLLDICPCHFASVTHKILGFSIFYKKF